MRVAFLVHELGRSGGMAMIMERARALDAELVVTGPKQGDLRAEHEGVPVMPLGRARNAAFDVAIATWWATAAALFEVKADRRALFLQNVEHRFYRPHEGADRAGAAAVLALPVDYIVVADFMRDLLDELRPDARCHMARYGIDKDVFHPRERPPSDGPLRVLVEGQPTLWFKGVPEAVAAVRAMNEPSTVTVVAHDPQAAEGIDADRVASGLDREGMAELYAEHDVLLKMPRFEGFGLPPLEAFHVGTPCVATPYSGQEEYMEHGVNGLHVGFDDTRGTADALDLLARDRGLLARLSEGALDSARAWPSREQALEEFEKAVRRIHSAPAPEPGPALALAGRVQRMELELAREEARQGRLLGEMALEQKRAYEHAAAEALELSLSREECSQMLDGARAELESVRNERAYKMAVRLRRLMPGKDS